MRTCAPAKINLFLGVSDERDERGYHFVTSLMCPLELSDDVEVKPRAGAGVDLACEPDPVGEARENLAYKAAVRLGEALGRVPDVSVRITKRIPSQAGLGGGSSDAAAVLRCLASLWGVDATDARVVGVARSLGADVPFFLYGGACLMLGCGDEFSERVEVPALPLAVVRPPAGVSTPAAYRAFDEDKTPTPSAEALMGHLRERDVPGALALFENNLQSAACRVQPLVGEALALLSSFDGGVARPLLCGSGSACALFVGDDEQAARVCELARARGWWACATRVAAERPALREA